MFYDKSYHQHALYQHHQAATASALHHHHHQQQQQQQQHQHQQQQQQQRYDAIRDWTLTQSQHRNQQLYQTAWPSARPPMLAGQTRAYSGVEQLLMAAMLEGNYHPPPPAPHASGYAAFSAMPEPLWTIPRRSPSPPGSGSQHEQPATAPIDGVTEARAPTALHADPAPEAAQAASVQSISEPVADYLPTGRGLGYRQPARFHLSEGRIRADIPCPRNSSELGLHRLLESANLLDYFGTFLHFGGDDVQQLSDADEEEFMEIMDLVGMNKKPLHIRRLQRALANWRRCQKERAHQDQQDEFEQDDESDNTHHHQQQQQLQEHRLGSELFKRPRLEQASLITGSCLTNRCSSPCESRRSNYTSVTIDTSQPPTPRSTASSSSQSFFMIPDETRDRRSLNTDDNLSNQPEHNYQRPHVLVNAPKRIRLFNPTQMNRNQCKTT